MYRAQFHMMKANRVIYGTPLMVSCGKSIASFVLAFTVPGKRIEYLEECIGYFAILRTDLEFCMTERIFQFKKRVNGVDNNGKPIEYETKEDKISSEAIEIFNLVGRIDSDMCKWRASLTKARPCVNEHAAD